jgi:E3 ubiquitin-protein ligase RNF115/126
MADHTGPSRHQEVVYCHQCEIDWHKDEFALMCPYCGGEVPNIVSPYARVRMESDFSLQGRGSSLEEALYDLDSLDDQLDDDEGDIEEYIRHGLDGRTTLFSQIFNTRGPAGNPNVIQDFHSMIGQFMGSNLREGRPSGSGLDAFFSRSELEPFHFVGRIDGPHIVRHGFTWTTSDRDREDFPTYVSPNSASSPILSHLEHVLTIMLRGIFNAMGPLGHPDGEPTGRMPIGLQALFERIMSALMEQQSNAPGPANQEAIAALLKKNINEEMLGPELKAECSVCMDDVAVGVEVVVLPCDHWFHEACVTAWLNEHNTCPICRAGIEIAKPPLPPRPSQSGPPSAPSDNVRRTPTNGS